MAANRHLRKQNDAINAYLHECSQLLPSYSNHYIIPPMIKQICGKYYHIPFIPKHPPQPDNSSDDILFQCNDLRAYRWDPSLNKWRRRGKGTLTIYHLIDLDISQLLFYDEIHRKVRLLQYIDGKQYAKIDDKLDSEDIRRIVWDGSDYTMDSANPLIGTWKINFFLDRNDFWTLSKQSNTFLKLFNQSINNFNKEKLISLVPAPLQYKCFICGSIGKHWMFNCMDLLEKFINNKKQLQNVNEDKSHEFTMERKRKTNLHANEFTFVSWNASNNIAKTKRKIWKAKRIVGKDVSLDNSTEIYCKICNVNVTDSVGLLIHIQAKHDMQKLDQYYDIFGRYKE